MASLLFRQEAIEKGRNRLTGTVVAAVPPSSRLYTALATAIVVLIILVLTFGNYARRVQVRGVVAYSAGIASVSSPPDARIEQLFVKEGQKVTRGAQLVRISLTQGQDAGGEGIDSQLAELNRQYQELEKQRSLAGGLTTSENSALSAQRTGAAEAIESLTRQQSLLAKQIKLNEAQYQRALRLMKQGAGTKQEMENSEAAVIATRLSYETLSEKIIGKREEWKTLQSQSASRAISGFQSESQITERMAAIAIERASLLRQGRLTLAAPIDGVVGDIALRPGQQVSSTTSIISVIPENSKLEAQLYAPSSAVGFVKPGQNVRLMFDAFPFQKYGTSRGTVLWVSTVPASPSGLPTTSEGEPVFRIRVALNQQDQANLNTKGNLRTGMTLSANLILEDRSLWEVFLGPIFRAVRS